MERELVLQILGLTELTDEETVKERITQSSGP